MSSVPAKLLSQPLPAIYAWRRVALVAFVAGLMSLMLSPGFETTPLPELYARELFIGSCCLVAFGVLERWPAQLPRWLPRWVLQLVGVAISVPLAVLVMYFVISRNDAVPWWDDEKRLTGFAVATMTGLLVAPWIAVAALYRKLDFVARSQALAFDLERSELERNALDSRLRLLQAQVEPHFLFNTLANVRELVDSGSPQASSVLDHLISYLRAAVPRLNEAATTLGHELQLVRAYLEIMHMRMPDRLSFDIHADEQALTLRCPPTTLLTLVENAVRHGIDPSEEGGAIDIRVELRAGRCHARICDTGVGLKTTGRSPGTGLATLEERLMLVFGGDARLELSTREPHGVCVELEFPARGAP